MSFITPNISTATANGPLFGPTNEITWRNSINFRNVECDRPVLNVMTCSGPIFGASGDSVQLDDEDDSDAANSTAEVNGSDDADVPSSNNRGSEANGEECSDNAEATDSDDAEVDLGINDDSNVSEEEDDEADVDASDNENDSEVDDEENSDNAELNDSDYVDVTSGSSDYNASEVSDEDDTDLDDDAESDDESTAEEEISSLNFGAPSKSNTAANVENKSNAKAKSTQQPAVSYDRNSSTKNDTNSAKGGSAQRNAAMEPVAGPSSAPDFPPPTTDADSNLHLSLTFLHDILKSGLNSESYSKLKSEYAVSCESLLKGPVMNKEIKNVLTQEVKNTDETIKEVQDKIGIGISALNTAIHLLIGEKRLPHALRAILNACRIFADLHYEVTKKRQAVTQGMLDDSNLETALCKSIRDETLFGTDLKEKVNVKDIKRKNRRRKTETKVVSSSQSRFAGQNTISVKRKGHANKIPTTSNAESTKPNPGPSNTNLEPSTSNHDSTTSDPESPTSHEEPVTSNSKPTIASLESAISTLEGTVSRFVKNSLTNQLPSNTVTCDKMTISGLRTAFQGMEKVISSYKKGITIDNTNSTLTNNPTFLSDKPATSSQPASTENSKIMTEKGLKQHSKSTSLNEAVNQQVTTSKEGANSATTSNPKATTSKEDANSATTSNPKATNWREGANSATTSNPRATTLKEDTNSATTSNPKATNQREGANSATTSNPSPNPRVTTSKEDANSATTSNPRATTSKEDANSATTSKPKATNWRGGANSATTSNPSPNPRVTTSKKDANSATTSNPRATTSKEDANSATTSNPKATNWRGGANSATTSNPSPNPRVTTSKKDANSATTSNPRATTSKEDANSATTSNPKATNWRGGANSATTSNPRATTSKKDANPATNSNSKTSISREVPESSNRKTSDPIVDISSRRSMESAVRAAAFSILEAGWATIKKVLTNLQLGRESNPESREAETISRQQTVYSKNLLITELDHIVKNLNAYILQQKEQHKSSSQRIFSFDTMFNDNEKITSEKSNTTDETRLIKFLKIAVSIIQTAKSALTLNPLGSQFIASNADAFVTPIELINSCLDMEVETIATNDEVASLNQAVPSDSLKNAASILRHIISDIDIMSTKLAKTKQMREQWNIQATIEELKDVILKFKTAIPILELLNNVITDQDYPWNRPISTFVKKYTDINLYLFNIETCVLILTNTLKQEPGELLTKANQENIIAILEDTLQKMEKNVTTLKIHVRDQNYASNNPTAGNTNQNDNALDLKGKQVKHEQNAVRNAEVVVSNIKATPLSHEYKVTNQKTAKIINKKEEVTKEQPTSTDLNKGLTQAATGSSQVPSKDSELRDDLREQGELELMINSLNDVINSVKTDLGANLKQFDENFHSRLNNIKTQLESKISNIDANNTQVINDAADINRTEAQGARNVKRENDKQAGRSKVVLNVAKTRPGGERDEHAVTAARPGGGKYVHSETEIRPGRSKDVHSETEIRPGGSKVVHKVTETRPGGSKDVHSEIRPGGSKDVHSETEVRLGKSKSVHSETETRPAGSKDIHSETETRPAGSKDLHSETEVRLGESKSVHNVAESQSGGSKNIHNVTKTLSGGNHNSIEATSVKDENSTPETQTSGSEEYRSVKDIIKSMNDRTKLSNTDKIKSEMKN